MQDPVDQGPLVDLLADLDLDLLVDLGSLVVLDLAVGPAPPARGPHPRKVWIPGLLVSSM